MTPFVGSLVEAEGLLAIGLVRNDGRCSTPNEPFAQFRTIIGFIAKQFLRRFGALDETLCGRTIVGLTARQQDGKKTAFSICDCMDFRVAPATRAANCLLKLPLFAPEAGATSMVHPLNGR
jgi:hypothetical protein